MKFSLLLTEEQARVLKWAVEDRADEHKTMIQEYKDTGHPGSRDLRSLPAGHGWIVEQGDREIVFLERVKLYLEDLIYNSKI